MASAGDPPSTPRPRGVLIIVENLSVPFDRRVWSEAQTLREAGYQVSVICPRGSQAEKRFEVIDHVHIFRHPMPHEASGKLGYLVEYASALFWEMTYSVRVFRRRGFDVIHACNPPDLIFLVGSIYKLLLRRKFLFDHHDASPEFFEAKFGRRGFFWRLLVLCERLTFMTADISIATNESYRRVAIERGRMPPDRVFVVRSGPNTERMKPLPPDPAWRKGRGHLVAYVGVIGEPEGLDLLLASVDDIVRARGRQDIQFVVMGSGPRLADINRLATKMGLTKHVTLTGRVDDATLMTVLATADVCVNPDRPDIINDMSTMNKIMEYMAMGKPIVQFDLVEGRVSAGEASLYARNTDVTDFADKIIQLVDDPARRERMGNFGRKRIAEELSWKHEAPKLLAAYDMLFR